MFNNIGTHNIVSFTEESLSRLTQCDGRLRVYRRHGMHHAERAAQEIDSFGAGSVMMWDGITNNGRADLMEIRRRLNSARYIAEIVLEHVMPFAVGMRHQFVFQ
mgnify:CR=1 FL=1